MVSLSPQAPMESVQCRPPLAIQALSISLEPASVLAAGGTTSSLLLMLFSFRNQILDFPFWNQRSITFGTLKNFPLESGALASAASRGSEGRGSSGRMA